MNRATKVIPDKVKLSIKGFFERKKGSDWLKKLECLKEEDGGDFHLDWREQAAFFNFLIRIQFDEIESRVLDSRSFPRRDLSPIDFLGVVSFDDAELVGEETSGRVTDFRSAPC